MGNFKRPGGGGGGFRGGRDGGSRFGGGRPSFGGRGGGSRDRGDVQMHRATCAECNKSCEVPFRPTGERPVYCSECFGGSKGRSPRESSSRESFTPRESFSPVGSPAPKFDDKKIDELKRQIGEVEKKVERIINLLENNSKKHEDVVALSVSAPSFKKVADKKAKPAKVAKKKVSSKKSK